MKYVNPLRKYDHQLPYMLRESSNAIRLWSYQITRGGPGDTDAWWRQTEEILQVMQEVLNGK